MLSNHRQPGARAGYSLIEVLVTMAVASVAILVAVQLYGQTEKLLGRQRDDAATLGAGADLLSLLRMDVRGASDVGEGSDESRLVLVAADGAEVTYEATPEAVTRLGPESPLATATGSATVRARFEYPGAGLVRVSWSAKRAARSVTLHLRNHGT